MRPGGVMCTLIIYTLFTHTHTHTLGYSLTCGLRTVNRIITIVHVVPMHEAKTIILRLHHTLSQMWSETLQVVTRWS